MKLNWVVTQKRIPPNYFIGFIHWIFKIYLQIQFSILDKPRWKHNTTLCKKRSSWYFCYLEIKVGHLLGWFGWIVFEFWWGPSKKKPNLQSFLKHFPAPHPHPHTLSSGLLCAVFSFGTIYMLKNHIWHLPTLWRY